jgi:hypothetical protein
MYRAPIVIMSFDRPDYLRRVLISLKNQDTDVKSRGLYVFQDGGYHPVSYRRYCDEATVEECVRTVRDIFPQAVVFNSPLNLGVGENRFRAEDYMFNHLGSEAAHFLEDDLELEAHYIRTLDVLSEWARKSGKVAYVSAYSRSMEAAEQQMLNRSALIPMAHIWGVSLIRNAWLKMEPHVRHYLSLIRGSDYRYRNHREIYEYYMSLGLGGNGTSQDSMHHVAAVLEGFASFSTYTVNARYIGEKGVHQFPERFRAAGFAEQATVGSAPDSFDYPDNQEIDRLLERTRAKMAKFAREDLPKKLEGLGDRTHKRPIDERSASILIRAMVSSKHVDRHLLQECLSLGSIEDVVDYLIVKKDFLRRIKIVQARAAAAPSIGGGS